MDPDNIDQLISTVSQYGDPNVAAANQVGGTDGFAGLNSPLSSNSTTGSLLDKITGGLSKQAGNVAALGSQVAKMGVAPVQGPQGIQQLTPAQAHQPNGGGQSLLQLIFGNSGAFNGS